MNIDKRILIRAIRDSLDLDGFKANSTGAGIVSLVKNENDREQKIIISYRKHLGTYVLAPALSGWLTFNKVEDFLEKYFVEYNLNCGRNTAYINSSRNEIIERYEIGNTEDVDKVSAHLKKLIINEIIPFFNEYSTLKLVNSKIDELGINNTGKFIRFPSHVRVIVIKKLVNDDWREYSKYVMEEYKELSEGKYKHAFAPIYNFLPSLVDELRDL